MHEMSLCESLLKVMEQEARRQDFHKVLRVRLQIGALAGVEVEALRFGFEVVTRESLAEGAALEVSHQPGRAWCLGCTSEVEVDERWAACPRCGGYGLRVTGGDEMKIMDLEVE